MLRTFRRSATLGFVLLLIGAGAVSASAQITANPSTLNYGMVGVNVVGFAPRVGITNHNSTAANLSSVVFSLPQYKFNTGLGIQTIGKGQTVQFSFTFLALQAGTYNGTITFNFKNFPSVVVQVEATAFNPTAAATLSANSLSFGTLALGTVSSQSVTVTNAMNQPESLMLTNVKAYYQPFSASPLINPVTLQPGGSYTFTVSFSPLILGPTTGIVTLCFDVLPCMGIDLTGAGSAPTNLAVTNFPALPYATQGFAYQAGFTATGGTPPYRWRIQSGSQIPGLTLSQSTGVLSGTVSSTFATGIYNFTVQAQDSSRPAHSATQNVTFTVEGPTGANCNVISVDVPNTSTPITDLMDLGTGTYLGQEGGLYPDGSNTDPDPHESDGVAFAQAIGPTDPGGGADPTNGRIVMLILGESATEQPLNEFITESTADPLTNPLFLPVNGAQGGATANLLQLKSSVYWDQINHYLLPQALYPSPACPSTPGVCAVGPKQVQIVWINDVNSTTQSFPGDAQTLQGDYETIAADILYYYKNVKLVFFSSLNYSGYSQGVDSNVPEPVSYESAFGAKWAIQDQINGVCCNYNPANGTVTAPWMGWSFYYWGNGLIPRSDGETWSCQDINSDGLHPADPWGHIKITSYLVNWFKNSELTTPWYLAPGPR